MHQRTLTLSTPGRGLHDITREIAEVVTFSDVHTGLCHVFCMHTSASLCVQENADPDVLRDLETWMAGAVVDGDPRFRHRDEGPDDMSGHVRSALTGPSLTVPVGGGRLLLGTWQGVYLWEHRTSPKRRHVVVTVHGD